jgi:hypothetical protein
VNEPNTPVLPILPSDVDLGLFHIRAGRALSEVLDDGLDSFHPV